MKYVSYVFLATTVCHKVCVAELFFLDIFSLPGHLSTGFLLLTDFSGFLVYIFCQKDVVSK